MTLSRIFKQHWRLILVMPIPISGSLQPSKISVKFQEAKTHYERALDLDALRFRADTKINQIIQEVAASVEDDAFSFVDSAAAFEQASQPFQPGWNLLLEHVHYDFAGNHILAAEISRSIMSNLTSPMITNLCPASKSPGGLDSRITTRSGK